MESSPWKTPSLRRAGSSTTGSCVWTSPSASCCCSGPPSGRCGSLGEGQPPSPGLWWCSIAGVVLIAFRRLRHQRLRRPRFRPPRGAHRRAAHHVRSRLAARGAGAVRPARRPRLRVWFSHLNGLTLLLSLVGAFLAASYPFTKRLTHLPQAYLGAAFGWAVPMAFAAQTGSVDPRSW